MASVRSLRLPTARSYTSSMYRLGIRSSSAAMSANALYSAAVCRPVPERRDTERA